MPSYRYHRRYVMDNDLKEIAYKINNAKEYEIENPTVEDVIIEMKAFKGELENEL